MTADAAAGPARVLIVDDHAMFGESLKLAIDAEDDLVVVAVATSLAAARSRILDRHPDVVVLDHRLPDGDGVAALEDLRALRPSIQVVVLTAIATDSLLASAVHAGAAGFVVKSDSVDNLLAAIRAAAAGESVISPALLARLLPRLGAPRQDIGRDLSEREFEVLRLLCDGLTNRAIAERLHLSPHTVRNHIASISAKLGAHSKLEILAIATREGLAAN